MTFLNQIPFLVFTCATIFNWLSTFLGASLVYIGHKKNENIISIALGSSAGIMIAASFFSLILPAMELLDGLKKYYLLIIPFGFFCGVLFLILCNMYISHNNISENTIQKDMKIRSNLLLLAMTLHNIPEGFAVGVAFACASKNVIPALILSIGIGIQNFPEGAAISLPMHQSGHSKFASLMYGQFSGIVEIPAAFIGYIFATTIHCILPFCLSFAAGAMIFVCVKDLIPESITNQNIDLGSISCMTGFIIMMILDIMLS